MAIASYFLAAECVDRLVLVVLLGGNSALIRPPEELLHQKCGTLRGELDSPTPRVFGVFLMVVFED